jgi:hypothetical protein
MQKNDWQDTFFSIFNRLFPLPYFALSGKNTREIMALVQPGDVLLRVFTQSARRRLWSSTFQDIGFYLGAVNETHLRQWAKIDYTHPYAFGEQTIITSLSGEVVLMDLIDFCRCDGVAILRFPAQLKRQTNATPPQALIDYLNAPETRIKQLSQPTKKQQRNAPEIPPQEQIELDANFLTLIKAEKEIVHFLSQGKPLAFAKIMPIFYRLALRQLNPPAQFEIGLQLPKFLSSIELFYFIIKSVAWNYGIVPDEKRVLFRQYQTILVDDLIDTELEEVWKWVS